MDLAALSAQLSRTSPRVRLLVEDSAGQVLATLAVKQPVIAEAADGLLKLPTPLSGMAMQAGEAAAVVLATDEGQIWARQAVSLPFVYAGGTVAVSALSLTETGRLNIEIGYDSDVKRPLALTVCNMFQTAFAVQPKTTIDCDIGVNQAALHCLPHHHAAPVARKNCYTQYHAPELWQKACSGYRFGVPLSAKACGKYWQAIKREYRTCDRHQQAIAHSAKACGKYWQAVKVEPDKWCSRFEQAVFIDGKTCSLFKSSIRLELKRCAPYQHGLPIPCHASVEEPDIPVIPPQPDEPEKEPPTPKTYTTVFIVNEFALIDPETGANVPCLSASVQTDKNSYAWQFRLSLPYNVADSVQGRLKELEVRINGYVWRMVVTGRSKGEEFGQTTIQLTGTSPTVLLADPYAPTRSMAANEAATAKAIAEAELERVDLQTGFALDWQLTDPLAWQIPQGAMAYQDKTPMQVLKTLAEAGGGWLYSHMNKREISVQPQYPKPFWQWKTPDLLIADSLILQRDSDYAENPLYDGVYVSGTQQGVTAFVRRSGTAGAYQAPMVSDPLITDETAARQRGLSVLSAGGKIMNVSLTLPLHEDTGVILPNTLVGVSDWLGLSTKTAIDVSWQNGLQIRQKISIERHLDEF